jgi:hypothetical protein
MEGRMQVVETLLKLLNSNESPKISRVQKSPAQKALLLVAARRVFIARGSAHVFP